MGQRCWPLAKKSSFQVGITFGPRSCDWYLSEEGGSGMSERWVIVTRVDAPGLLLLRLQQSPDKHPDPLECHPPSHSPPSSPPHTRRWSIFSRAHLQSVSLDSCISGLAGTVSCTQRMVKPLTPGVRPKRLGGVGRVQAPPHIEGKPDACQGAEVTSSWLIYGEQ